MLSTVAICVLLLLPEAIALGFSLWCQDEHWIIYLYFFCNISMASSKFLLYTFEDRFCNCLKDFLLYILLFCTTSIIGIVCYMGVLFMKIENLASKMTLVYIATILQCPISMLYCNHFLRRSSIISPEIIYEVKEINIQNVEESKDGYPNSFLTETTNETTSLSH